MKVLYIDLAKAVKLFDIRLLNPSGVSLAPAIKMLEEKYNFAKAPLNQLDLNNEKGLAFEYGQFKGKAVGLTIFRDGIVADTFSSTDDANDFLEDATNWLIEEFGLVDPPHRTFFLSQVTAQFPKPLQLVNPALSFIGEVIKSAPTNATSGAPFEYSASGLQCSGEDRPDSTIGVFRLERKYGVPFSENQYFSQAPLRTVEHLALLQEIENATRH